MARRTFTTLQSIPACRAHTTAVDAQPHIHTAPQNQTPLKRWTGMRPTHTFGRRKSSAPRARRTPGSRMPLAADAGFAWNSKTSACFGFAPFHPPTPPDGQQARSPSPSQRSKTRTWWAHLLVARAVYRDQEWRKLPSLHLDVIYGLTRVIF